MSKILFPMFVRGEVNFIKEPNLGVTQKLKHSLEIIENMPSSIDAIIKYMKGVVT